MTEREQSLTREAEAAKQSIQQQAHALQQNLTKLLAMIEGPDEAWDHYQFEVWAQGDAARRAAQIGSFLSRYQALQEALHLSKREAEGQA